MFIDHIAIWTNDIEKLKVFYVKYFGAVANEKYINSKKGFESYFLSFVSGSRIEIMQRVDITESMGDALEQYIGITHIAIKMDSDKDVDILTELLRSDGYNIIGEPRTSGDGYYESVILDPDGNRIELVF